MGFPPQGFLQAATEAWLCDKMDLLEKINKALLSRKSIPAPVEYMKRIYAHVYEK
ncbi:MAG TPA: hypothetical protein VK518_10425 [Puia sp.]|nr:hypothetical protein [Puia sp.]